MNIQIRQYKECDLPAMTRIWNEVVEEGIAFPQEEGLDSETAAPFFGGQSYCGVAEDSDSGKIYGLYILHPNNVGRCGHLANASFAVSSESRGLHIGEKLVRDCLIQGKTLGFKVLQFNAVVDSNIHARHLYERLGFELLGTVPEGFRMKDGHYEDICLYYQVL
ncbi:MAG: GNAT family N-acetyltransferase [Eubacteriaceae bacterium]|jgi:L-amino acid N-acyltransferase YncA